MSNNTNLHRAKNTKNDEFYTRIEDIEKELKNYKEFFKDKVVYCNCDKVDGENRSNFFVYFVKNFKEFGLKRLICTSYNKGGKGRLCIYDDDTNLNDIIDMDGDGDFRSEECIKWLEKCDVVVTNPPFSLFRDFVAQLVKYDKKFLIIGNMNAITYKDIFPFIKDNKIWWGINCVRWFIMPNNTDKKVKVNDKKEKLAGGANSRWFTNIPHSKHNLPLDLYKKYNPKDYPKYDNYDAINVNKTSDIPMDYDGVMGVPISFLDKYCPTQFEIVGGFNRYKECDYENGLLCGTPTLYIDKNGTEIIWRGPTVNKKNCYFRILIRRN